MIDDSVLLTPASRAEQSMADTYVSRVEFFVLGPLEYRVDDAPAVLGGPKQRAVLAHLLAHRGEVISLERLIVGVWGPDGARSLRSSVHTYISNLRVIVGYEIERIGDGYRLNLPPDAIDSVVFERMVDDAERQRSVNPATASHLARQALALWRGRAYADLEDVQGLQSEIRRLDDARLRAVELRIDTDIELGRHRTVIGELEALTADHPLNEGLHAKLMLALYRDGRQAEALRVAGRLRAHLAETLGVDPTPALLQLEDQILIHDPALDTLREARTEDLAFLFTDIEESTPLWESQPEWMRVSLARHDAVITDCVERHAGTVVKHTGDGVIAAFTSVEDAVGAAEHAQLELTALDWGILGPLKVRMAVDAGEVEVRNADYFGTPMNRGSRLQAAAHGGQIVLSSVAHERLAGLAGLQTRNLGEFRLKGIGTPQRVFQLVADDLPSEFPALSVDGRRDDAEGRAFGDTIRGYELRERIGAGRFGVVYRAYQPSIGREVAVKVLPETVSNHPSFIRTFERDARLVAKLAHPHVVALFDFWRDNGGAYFVMPLLPGNRPAPETRLPMATVAKVVDQVGSALSYAHRHGVLHRDLDPGSILYDTDGNAYLSGFRIGTQALDDHIADPYTAFRAPERSNGVPIDQRTDIYGLGAIATYLITGQTVDRVDFSHIPGGDILAIATAVDLDERFSTVDDFVAEFPVDGAERTAQSAPSRNPYKGLAAFDEGDAEDFFGRDEHTGALVDLVGAHRLVTVVGPSGSGKSSLVRAGLVPALRAGVFEGSDRWLPVVMLPGAHPFDELLTALGSVATENLGEMLEMLTADDHGLLRLSRRIMRDLDGDLLLVIDQFEELYTLLTSDEIRDQFVASLIEAIEDPHSRLRIVITIRADFFDQPLLDDRLGPVIARTNLTVATPAPDQLLEAITGPAQLAGLELEGGLAERIVEDVRSEPGGLPLMQFTLQALADVSIPGWLTHENYSGIGGVTGALSARADDVFERLSGSDQMVAQRVLLRLVSVSEDNDDVRRRVRSSELETLASETAAVDRVLSAFGAARLLTFDRDPVTRGPTVEVAHEALLREWDRFRDWVDEQRSDLIIHRRFAAALDEWRSASESDDHLPTGGRLAQFEEWFPRAEPWLSETERAFHQRGIDRRDLERKRRASRRRRVVAALAAAAVVSAVMAGLAWVQANLASARELIAEAEIQLDEDPELAILLGLEASSRFDRFGSIPARVTDLLRAAISANPLVGRIPHGSAVTVTADGTMVITAEEAGGVARIWDPHTFELLAEIEPPAGRSIIYVYPRAVADEVFMGTVSDDGAQEVWAWSVTQRQFLERLTSEAYRGLLAGWFDASPDGRLIAESADAELAVTERRTGHVIFRVPIRSGSEHRFLEDESIAILAETDTGIRFQIHDLDSGTVTTDFEVEGQVPEPLFAEPSPTGDTIIVASQAAIAAFETNGHPLWASGDLGRVFRPVWLSEDRVMVGGEGLPVILDAATGEVESSLPGHRGGTWSYVPIPNTSLVVSASLPRGETGGETVVFETGPRSSPIPLENPLTYIEVANDGSALIRGREDVAAVSSSGALEYWFPGTTPAVGDATWGFPVISSPGDHLAYIGAAGESLLWSIRDGRNIYEAPAGFSVRGISDDGSIAVISAGDDTQVVDTRTGESIAQLDAGIDVSYAFFPADDRYVIISSNDMPYFTLWNTSDYQRIAAFGSEDAFEWMGLLTPDGDSFVTAGADGTLRIYDFAGLIGGASAGEAIRAQIDAHNNFIPGIDLSGDGHHLVSVSFDEPARVWDLRTGDLVATVGENAPAIGFHPTEDRLYVAENGQLDVVELDIAAVLEQARASLTRDLTPAECETYLRRSCNVPTP